MTLKDFALSLKKELDNDPTEKKAIEISKKIKDIRYDDGSSLSEQDINNVLKYIEFPDYNPSTGMHKIYESDNSDFLKLVAIISNETKK